MKVSAIFYRRPCHAARTSVAAPVLLATTGVEPLVALIAQALCDVAPAIANRRFFLPFSGPIFCGGHWLLLFG
jgi:hypothetical protein